MSEPVFVDATGRRARAVQVVCWLLGLVMLGYVTLVATALVAPPGAVSLRLPGLGPVVPSTTPPELATPDGSTPANVLATLPTPAAPPPSPAARPAVPGAGSVPTSASTPRARPSARPTAVPSAAATAAPTIPGKGQGAPSTRPTPRGNPRATPSKPPRP